jgi:hypothetical protein
MELGPQEGQDVRRLGIIAEGQEVIEDIDDDAVAPVSWLPVRPRNITKSRATARWPPELLGLDGSVSTRLYSPAAVVALRISSIRCGQGFGFESLQYDLLRQQSPDANSPSGA